MTCRQWLRKWTKLILRDVAVLVVLLVLAEGIYHLVRAAQVRGAEGEETFVLYVLGGSSARGEPYDISGPDGVDSFSMVDVVDGMFESSFAGRPIQVINLAQRGESVYAQYIRFRRIAPVRDASHPGAVLIYSGHNDPVGDTVAEGHGELDGRSRERWLNRHSLLMTELTHAYRRQRALPPQYSSGNYEYYYRQLIELARANGLVPVAATMAGNVARVEPSIPHRPRVQTRVLENMESIVEVLRRGDWTSALERFEEWEEAEPLAGAFYLYQQARCLEALARHEEASARYWRAVERDNGSEVFRMKPSQNELVRRLAAEYEIPLAAVVEALTEASPNGIVGNELFADSTHANLAGYRLIGGAFAAALSSHFGEPIRRPLEALPPEAAGQESLASTLGAASGILATSAHGVWPKDRLRLAILRFEEALSFDSEALSAWLGLAVSHAAMNWAWREPEMVQVVGELRGFNGRFWETPSEETFGWLMDRFAAYDVPTEVLDGLQQSYTSQP